MFTDPGKKDEKEAQPAHNIPEIFPQHYHVRDIQGTFNLGNILKENTFLKVLDEKVAFMLKVFHLIITSVDLSANSSNHEVMFPEYSKNIPRLSVSNIFQGYPGIL